MDSFIDDFYQAVDGDDWQPAFQRALAVLTPPLPNTGFTLKFKPHEYWFSKTLELTRPLHLQGSGVPFNAGTILKFPEGQKGIIVHGNGTALHKEYGGIGGIQDAFAEDSILERLTITAGNPLQNPQPKPLLDLTESGIHPNQGAHGITLYARAVLRDVCVTGMSGHGVYAFGVTGADILHIGTTTNVDFSRFDHLICCACGGDGLHIYGSDANYLTVTASQFINGFGWGVQDFNQVGGATLIACQFSYNALGGLNHPASLFNHGYKTLADELQYKVGRAGTNVNPRTVQGWNILIQTLTNLKPVQQWLNEALYPNLSVAPEQPDYRQEIQRYHADAQELAGKIAQQLEKALLNQGFAQDEVSGFYEFIHHDLSCPYPGAITLISCYGESNGMGSTQSNVLSSQTQLLGSTLLDGYGSALRYGPESFRNSFRGPVWIADGALLLGETGVGTGIPMQVISSANAMPVDAPIHGQGVVYNSNPQTGGEVGWVWTSAGWKSFGTVNV